MADLTNDGTAVRMCSKCDEAEAGPGGILCPDCLAVISAQRLPAAGAE